MPAAAVIPAPEAYVKVAAVKTLVVGIVGECVAVFGGSQTRWVLVITPGLFVNSSSSNLP